MIMLDLETWGKRPGCDIRSIGACVFDPVAGTVSDTDQFYIACDNPYKIGYPPDPKHGLRKYPLHRDPDTVQWWSEQSEAAQTAFADPVDLREALERFSEWYETVGATTIYAHGPQFDISILEAAYHAVDLPVPWHYRAPRDTRTVFDMAGITDHSAWLREHATGTAHHALDDAICQARAVCAAWNRRNNS